MQLGNQSKPPFLVGLPPTPEEPSDDIFAFQPEAEPAVPPAAITPLKRSHSVASLTDADDEQNDGQAGSHLSKKINIEQKNENNGRQTPPAAATPFNPAALFTPTKRTANPTGNDTATLTPPIERSFTPPPKPCPKAPIRLELFAVFMYDCRKRPRRIGTAEEEERYNIYLERQFELWKKQQTPESLAEKRRACQASIQASMQNPSARINTTKVTKSSIFTTVTHTAQSIFSQACEAAQQAGVAISSIITTRLRQ